jgi:hypothetical protein
VRHAELLAVLESAQQGASFEPGGGRERRRLHLAAQPDQRLIGRRHIS